MLPKVRNQELSLSKLIMSRNGRSSKPEEELVRSLMTNLRTAKSEYRIRIGLQNSLKLLDVNSSSVLMCVLPVNTTDTQIDPLTHLEQTLIEAYCKENSVRILKMSMSDEIWSSVKVFAESLLEGESGILDDDDDDDEVINDASIILIQATADGSLEEEEFKRIFDFTNARSRIERPTIRTPSR